MCCNIKNHNTCRDHSQFSQRGEQSPVTGVLLQVVRHCLDNRHIIIKISGPFTDQCGETLCGHDRKWDKQFSSCPKWWFNTQDLWRPLKNRYLVISFEEFVQDHLIDGRSEAQIPSGQILTDGLKPESGGSVLIRAWISRCPCDPQFLTYLQLPDGFEPVHFIFPQFHVFPQHLLTLPGFRKKKQLNYQMKHKDVAARGPDLWMCCWLLESQNKDNLTHIWQTHCCGHQTD